MFHSELPLFSSASEVLEVSSKVCLSKKVLCCKKKHPQQIQLCRTADSEGRVPHFVVGPPMDLTVSHGGPRELTTDFRTLGTGIGRLDKPHPVPRP